MTKQEEIIEKEPKITDFLNGKFKYDNYGQYIWLVEQDGNHQKIADIRGWGRIQHFFMNKKGRLDEKKAGEFQDKCGEWVVNALNKALELELSRLKEKEEVMLCEDKSSIIWQRREDDEKAKIINSQILYTQNPECCDVCGNHPSIIIRTQFGTFCQIHAKYV
jgi:hypothetical protein